MSGKKKIWRKNEATIVKRKGNARQKKNNRRLGSKRRVAVQSIATGLWFKAGKVQPDSSLR